jgi:hypothetical protein
MAKRARLVLNLVERIRKDKAPADTLSNGVNPAEAGRKRGWDEVAQGELYQPRPQNQYQSILEEEPPAQTQPPQPLTNGPTYEDVEFKDPDARSLAERDMATIRSKRSAAAAVAAANASANAIAGHTEGSNGSGDKSPSTKKSRKRGVSSSLSHKCISRLNQPQRTPLPGKCHSCNIRETPEWRRGPDGARTLCNACGLRELESRFGLVLLLLNLTTHRLRETRPKAR